MGEPQEARDLVGVDEVININLPTHTVESTHVDFAAGQSGCRLLYMRVEPLGVMSARRRGSTLECAALGMLQPLSSCTALSDPANVFLNTRQLLFTADIRLGA